MCGIGGILNINGAPVADKHLQAMASAIAYRGPDGDGLYTNVNVGLLHRRLAIIDLTDKGKQPMTSANGRWTVVFNGCIYNYKELKKELEQKGNRFTSQTDTEVIVEGLAAYGPAFIERLNGMFAIAAWHADESSLYLSRDRFGVKPLYYWCNGKTIVFASEIKAIRQHPDFVMDVDYGALNQYFTFQNVFTHDTLFKGVHMLPPASTAKVNVHTTQIKPVVWWDYDFTNVDEHISFEDAVNLTKSGFETAVERQMVSDVPVGSYLSGGMDSGSITAIASKHIPRISTFTAGFDMTEVTGVEANYDERRDAQLMSNYFNTQHYEQVINAGDLRWSLPRLVWHLEDLKAGMSYPHYYISRLASKFVKVCLQGTGGDELYGGYPWRYYRVFRSLNQQEFFNNYYSFWQRLVNDEDKKQLFTAHTYHAINVDQPRKIFESVFTFNNNLRYDTPEQQIANSLYFEIKTFLPALLTIGDRLSMAHGLEERFPFLDNDLVALGQKIPVRHKLANLGDMMRIDENEFGNKFSKYMEYNDGKTVLRSAMKDYLPPAVLSRKKQGFSAPDASWYRGENAAYVKELLLDRTPACAAFINTRYLEKIIHEHIDKHINHRLLLWSFLCFEWWCRIFINNESIDNNP
jgi:asparagine synthase (glutamine-hydrolyzing)